MLVQELAEHALLLRQHHALDISQHMIDPAPGAAQDHDLRTPKLQGQLDGNLRICGILDRIEGPKLDALLAPVIIHQLRRSCVEISHHMGGRDPTVKQEAQSVVHTYNPVKCFFFQKGQGKTALDSAPAYNQCSHFSVSSRIRIILHPVSSGSPSHSSARRRRRWRNRLR